MMSMTAAEGLVSLGTQTKLVEAGKSHIWLKLGDGEGSGAIF